MGGLAFSGPSKSFIHPKGISVSLFFFFVSCFHLRERESGKRKGKGESKKGEEGEMGERKKRKKERERKREERREERIFYLREREKSQSSKQNTKQKEKL